MDGSKGSRQPSQVQPLRREQQITQQRRRQKPEEPERPAKTMSQPFVVGEQVRHHQQVPQEKDFQKEPGIVQDRNQGSHPLCMCVGKHRFSGLNTCKVIFLNLDTLKDYI